MYRPRINVSATNNRGTEYFDLDLYCYQQVNGKGSFNGQPYSSTYLYSNLFEIDSFSGLFGCNFFYSYDPYISLVSDYECVSFDVASSYSLSEKSASSA